MAGVRPRRRDPRVPVRDRLLHRVAQPCAWAHHPRRAQHPAWGKARALGGGAGVRGRLHGGHRGAGSGAHEPERARGDGYGPAAPGLELFLRHRQGWARLAAARDGRHRAGRHRPWRAARFAAGVFEHAEAAAAPGRAAVPGAHRGDPLRAVFDLWAHLHPCLRTRRVHRCADARGVQHRSAQQALHRGDRVAGFSRLRRAARNGCLPAAAHPLCGAAAARPGVFLGCALPVRCQHPRGVRARPCRRRRHRRAAHFRHEPVRVE